MMVQPPGCMYLLEVVQLVQPPRPLFGQQIQDLDKNVSIQICLN